MKQRSFFSKALAGLLALLMVLSLLPLTALAEETDGPDSGGTGTDDTTSHNIYTHVADAQHGSVTTDQTTAASGTQVTITVTPNEGYTVSVVKVKIVGGATVYYSTANKNTHTFTMPGAAVEVSASFIAKGAAYDHLHLDKTAVLQSNGTWTITLEAYATGEVQYTTEQTVIPTDVILVLDQSGSMTNDSYKVEVNAVYEETNSTPTNQQLHNDGYYVKVEGEYYKLNAARLVDQNASTWRYTYNNASQYVSLAENATSNTILTSYTVNNRSRQFATGTGYLASNFLIYQRNRTGASWNRAYSYSLIQGTLPVDVSAPNASDSNANTALSKLRSHFAQYSTQNYTVEQVTVNNNTYAIVYTPATLNEVYKYTYSYVNDAGTEVSLGNSTTSAENNNLDNTAAALPEGTEVYIRTATIDDRIVALQNAANSFIDGLRLSAQEQGVDHRVAVVGFAGATVPANQSNDYYYINTELFIGATQYNYMSNGCGSSYNTNGNLANNHYHEAFQSVYNAENTTGYTNLKASINALAGNGPTYPAPGFAMAQGILDANAATIEEYKNGTRKAVVIFMTDGEPGWNGYNDEAAGNALTARNALVNNAVAKGYSVDIHTVALLDATPTGNDNTFLQSTVYPNTDDHSYTLARNGVDLENFFHKIEVGTSTTTTTINLTQNAYLVDRISEYFEMPALSGTDKDSIKNYLTKYVNVYTAGHIGGENFGMRVEHQNYGHDSSALDPENDNEVHVWPTYGETDGLVHGITAHNFDYLAPENMVVTGAFGYNDANDNQQYDAPEKYTDANHNGYCDVAELSTIPEGKAVNDGALYASTDDGYTDCEVKSSGKMLIVEITGLVAKDSAAKDELVNTNHESSGLWDRSDAHMPYEKIASFPMPEVYVVDSVYVVDYGKRVLLNRDSEIRTALGLDENGMDGFTLTTDTAGNIVGYTDRLSLKYGNVEFDSVWVDNTNTPETGDQIELQKVYYTPKTTLWDGYDTFYIFWHNALPASSEHVMKGDEVTGNGWSKVSVIPANNVYYEDSFVDNTEDQNDNIVGIIYGEGFNISTTGNEQGNTETPEGAEGEPYGGVHGWVDGLADDNADSNGSSHVITPGDTVTDTATATFTFTGTGFDLYSRTNSNTGTILAVVTPQDAGSTVKQSVFVVDTLSQSGEYYQVPVLSYTAKDTAGKIKHGTYKVEIRVTAAAGDRKTFYLDGIRIYNPISHENQMGDPTINENYDNELNAVFTEVRNILLHTGTVGENHDNDALMNNSAVFIDWVWSGIDDAGNPTGGSVETTKVGTYEDYGPKNEVYLKKGQAVVFKLAVNVGNHYYIGLKSLTGADVNAEISYGTSEEGGTTADVKKSITVNHSTDMYYEIIPGIDGMVCIKNVSDGEVLLSITKLRTTNDSAPDTDGGVEGVTVNQALAYAMAFVGLESAPDTEEPENPDIEPEVPDIDIDIDIDIDNPEPTPEPDQGGSFIDTLRDALMNLLDQLLDRLFGSVGDWMEA